MDQPPAPGPGGAPSRHRATTSEIAARTGFSRATVSYVLNDAPGHPVAEATRARILEAARELGHLPYAPARALRGERNRLVLVLTPGYAQGYVLGSYLDELTALLAARDVVAMTTVMAGADEGASEQIIALWNHVNPDVVIAAGGIIPEAARERIRRSHVVLVDDRDAVDHFQTSLLQAEHLAGRGVRRIVYAGPPGDALSVYSARSREGVAAGCARHGLDAPLAFAVGPDAAALDRAIDAWLALGPAPVGVCAHNDDLALRIIARMRMRGLEPGEDLLVIGSDDIPAAELELTTVHVEWTLVAQDVAAAALAEAGWGDPDRPRREPGDYYRVVVRTSA